MSVDEPNPSSDVVTALQQLGHFIRLHAREGDPPVSGFYSPRDDLRDMAPFFIAGSNLPRMEALLDDAVQAFGRENRVPPLDEQPDNRDPVSGASFAVEELWGRRKGYPLPFPCAYLAMSPDEYVELFRSAVEQLQAEPPSLTQDELKILTELNKCRTPRTQAQLEGDTGISLRTIGKILRRLSELEFVDRPAGPRKGSAITGQGRRYLG